MLLKSLHFELFADYHQFYLWDPEFVTFVPTDYNDEDVLRRIKTASHLIIVHPERDMTIPIELEVHDSEPEIEAGDWDHIAEASLELSSGKLQVHECTGGPIADLEFAPGWYRVRVMYGGFDTIAPVGTDGDDFYAIAIWPSAARDVVVLKQWGGKVAG